MDTKPTKEPTHQKTEEPTRKTQDKLHLAQSKDQVTHVKGGRIVAFDGACVDKDHKQWSLSCSGGEGSRAPGGSAPLREHRGDGT